MEVDLALLADAATIDGSGKLNILGIFDRLTTSSFPTRHPRLSLVLRFAAGLQEVGKHEVGIKLKAPDGKELVRIDGEMNLAPGPSGSGGAILVPHVLNMDGLIFPAAGRYAFDVRVDGEHHVTIPLTVHGPESTAHA
ncbi:MAG: hypothetical protein OEO79_07195 [Gemmatimonadota bacterium]|nr:hypothetical protein [Gemmatimonadota bacterium]MDH3422077.1 hypothetical protein [Gemmatimonadota bacterium]